MNAPLEQTLRAASPLHHTSCAKSPCIYVSNIGGNSVTVYSSTANGNVTPVQTIAGSNTQLNAPWGIAVDKARDLYVADYSNDSILVFGPGSNGNVQPSRAVAGQYTQIYYPTGLALDTKGGVYTTSEGQGDTGPFALLYFAPGASGDVAPTREVVGSNTQLSSPVAVTSYKKGVYVSNQGNVSSAALLGFTRTANGNATPRTVVSGGNAFAYPYVEGIAVSSAKANKGIAYVGNFDFDTSGPGQIVGFKYDANGDVAPQVAIVGSQTKLIWPFGVAVDKKGRIYVSDAGANAVYVFAATANGNVAPIQTISGTNTGLDAPQAIAVR